MRLESARVELNKFLSVFRFPQKNELLKLNWKYVKVGMEFHFDEMIVTDENSYVVFKINKDQYRGDYSDPALYSVDDKFVHILIPERAIFINRYNPRLFKSNKEHGVVSKIGGTPIISTDHKVIETEFSSRPWSATLIVEVPVNKGKGRP